MKRHPLLYKLLLPVISAVLAFAIGEVLLRVLYGNRDTLCVFPPDMRCEFDPDSSVIYGISGLKHFDTDRMGIRWFGTGHPHEYEALFLGGSTTECLYLDDKETWPCLLAAGLHLDGGSIGKSGQTSIDHYMQIKYFCPQLKKLKTVIIMCGLNDMVKFLADTGRLPCTGQHVEDSLYQATFTHTARFASSYGLRIVQLLRNVYRRCVPVRPPQTEQDRRGLIYKQWRDNRKAASSFIQRIDSVTLLQGLMAYRQNLTRMADEAARLHIGLVFIGQAAAWQDSMTDEEQARLWMGGTGDYQSGPGHAYYSASVMRHTLDAYNAVTEAVCRDRGLMYIAPETDPGRMKGWFYDDCHFTEKGAKDIAGYIYSRYHDK